MAIEHEFDHYTPEQKAAEFLKCRQNIIYFLLNYVCIPEIGGYTRYTNELLHSKLRRALIIAVRYGKLQLLMSRQLGKSTIAAVILEWAMNFFPNNKAIIINFAKSSADENMAKVLFIHQHLPEWLRSPLKFKGERKTYMPYSNGSVLRIYYPSPATPASNLARSLTASVIFIDESAHIRNIEEAYTSAQPVLSKARIQAKKNKYPFLLMMATTPNGTSGVGEFAYNMWSNGVDSDNLFEINDHGTDERLIPGYENILTDPGTNGIVNIRFHWSEDPTKSAVNDEGQNIWYLEQCRELNFNTRKINQELDIKFIGGTSCIFEDDFIELLHPNQSIKTIQTPHMTQFKQYVEFDPNNFYLIGIDTASSIVGDYCAIEVYDYIKFEQVGEFYARLGSLTKFAEICKFICNYIIDESQGKCLIGIEYNSIGKDIVERFENDEEVDYLQYMYAYKDDVNGIHTNTTSKDQMISIYYELVNTHPEYLHSTQLIDQLSSIERKTNGRISAVTGQHDDLFMASCFCAYMKRYEMLKIEPYVNRTAIDVNKSKLKSIQNAIFNKQFDSDIETGIETPGIYSEESEKQLDADENLNYDFLVSAANLNDGDDTCF